MWGQEWWAGWECVMGRGAEGEGRGGHAQDRGQGENGGRVPVYCASNNTVALHCCANACSVRCMQHAVSCGSGRRWIQ